MTDEEKKEKSELEIAYDMLTKAQAQANATANKMPAANYTPYENAINAAGNALVNRKPFQYDITGDALYQQYKNQYTAQGRAAMQDTMGRASMLTGGYGNSYAAQAGQQAYQGYMQQLNDRIPELYNLALNRYNAEGKPLEQSYDMAVDAYNRYGNQYKNEYSVWADQLSRADAAVKNAQGLYGDMYDSALDAETAQTKAAYDYATEMSKLAAKNPTYTVTEDDGTDTTYNVLDTSAREAIAKAYDNGGINGVNTWMLNNDGYNADDVQKYIDAYVGINGEYDAAETEKGSNPTSAETSAFEKIWSATKKETNGDMRAYGAEQLINQLNSLQAQGKKVNTLFKTYTGIDIMSYKDDKGLSLTPQIALEAFAALSEYGQKGLQKIVDKYPEYSEEAIYNVAHDLAE